jgi:hypothetical protein
MVVGRSAVEKKAGAAGGGEEAGRVGTSETGRMGTSGMGHAVTSPIPF